MEDEKSPQERIIQKLIGFNRGYLVALIVISSEIITAILTVIISLTYYGELRYNMLALGVIDSFIASLIVGGITVFFLTKIKETRHLNVALHEEIELRNEMEQELETYTRKLEKSNTLKDLFADIIHHDVLNPVGIVKSAVDMIEVEEELKDKTRIPMIQRNIRKITDIVESATAYAKLKKIKKLEKESLDLTEIITGVISGLKMYSSEKNQEIKFSSDKKHELKASRIIESVFVNILSNAVKYSEEGKEIKVRIEDDGVNKIISISDHGPGIDDAYKKQIFERFERKEREGVVGSGIGLAIVKRIVEMHKGEVWVEDNPSGTASVFFVSLPK